jgi:hypothetical protein
MTVRSRRRLRQQDDLAENVTLVEPPVGVLDPVERERRFDGHLELAGRASDAASLAPALSPARPNPGQVPCSLAEARPPLPV